MTVTAKSAAAPGEVRFTQTERELVYGVAFKYLKDADTAHDVAQDALLLAFRYRHSFRGQARFTTWLYRIAATSALMHLRRVRRRPQTLPMSREHEQLLPAQGAAQPSPEELSAAGETLARCERVVAEMGAKYQPIFRLRFVEGFSPREIAQRLGLELSTVKTRAHRASIRVRQRLLEDAALEAASAANGS
ncbi:MAG TPA: sigma-70 family RNA polymerase sigma factor [Polyangia bacterium]